MPKVVYLVRHGQGEHNVNDAHDILDPLLTDLGKKQCQDLRDAFAHHDDISLVVASPLKRTIQTAAHAFSPALEPCQVPFILAPLAQEISHYACDIGVDRESAIQDAPALIAEGAPAYNVDNLDTSLVGDDWNSKKGIYAPTVKAVRERAAALRSWIWQRPEECVVLVSHGGFLHYLTEDWTGYEKARGTGYMNCEYRKYEFSHDSTAADAHLVEVGSSREKIGRAAGLDAHIIHEIEEVEKASE